MISSTSTFLDEVLMGGKYQHVESHLSLFHSFIVAEYLPSSVNPSKFYGSYRLLKSDGEYRIIDEYRFRSQYVLVATPEEVKGEALGIKTGII